MYRPFQYFSLCGVGRLKPIFCLGPSRFRDVRWYGDTYRQENPDQDKRIEHKTTNMQNVKIKSQINQIMNFFDVSKNTAHDIIQGEPRLKQTDIYDLSRNIQILNSNGLNPDEVRGNLQLLYSCPLTVEHRIAILNELGLENLSAYHYTNFGKLFKNKVSHIKEKELLPSTYDALDVLPSLGVPKNVYEDFGFPHNVDKLRLAEVHRSLSLIYLCWYFDCERDKILRIHNIYPSTQTKSMRLQNLFFKKLNDNWNFSNDVILKNGFLLSGSPTNIELIEKYVKHLAGADPQFIGHRTPRIFTTSYHRLCQVSDILTKKLGVTEAAVLKTPQIFSLRPDTVDERIRQLQQTPEFAGMDLHPRILRLIYFNTKVKNRLVLLRQIKDTRAMPSLNKLTESQERFDNYVAHGYIKLNRRDIVTLLSKQFSVSSSFIRQKLRISSHTHETSVVSVEKNLAYLFEEGFVSEQILNSLEILLYPPELVMQHLQHMREKVKASSHQELVPSSRALQLLLYSLDKDVSY